MNNKPSKTSAFVYLVKLMLPLSICQYTVPRTGVLRKIPMFVRSPRCFVIPDNPHEESVHLLRVRFFLDCYSFEYLLNVKVFKDINRISFAMHN